METGMRADRLERLATIERDHFWFDARRRVVAHACRGLAVGPDAVVLDLGCGTGQMLRDLELSDRSFGIEPLALTHPSPALPMMSGAIERLPVRSHAVDLVLALDVLEHVDDREALIEIGRILQPGGALVLTVPAHPSLWSFRDDDAGHLRRYTRRTLRASLDEAGFAIDRCSAFHGTILPLIAASRVTARWSQRRRDAEDQPPAVLNHMLRRITGVEAALAERGVRPPIGSSLIAIARNTRGIQ